LGGETLPAPALPVWAGTCNV